MEMEEENKQDNQTNKPVPLLVKIIATFFLVMGLFGLPWIFTTPIILFTSVCYVISSIGIGKMKIWGLRWFYGALILYGVAYIYLAGSLISSGVLTAIHLRKATSFEGLEFIIIFSLLLIVNLLALIYLRSVRKKFS